MGEKYVLVVCESFLYDYDFEMFSITKDKNKAMIFDTKEEAEKIKDLMESIYKYEVSMDLL